MDFVLQTPSLQHLAAVKLTTSLWNQRDVWTEIIAAIKCTDEESVDYERAEFCGREESDEWKSIEDKVKAKVSLLHLPRTCKQHLINVIKPLGIQVLNWCMCYNYYEDNNTDLMCLIRNRPNTFRWTFLGTVDYKQTAQLILKNQEFDILERYKLACLECSEEDVEALIDRIDEARKKEFINNHGNIKLCNLRQRLIAAWTCTVGEDIDQLPAKFLPGAGLNYNAFDCAVSYGNRGACDYFFEKVSPNYTVQLLLGQFGWRGFLNLNIIVFHLWSRLGAEQQERLCHMDFGHLLKFFLCWPFQSLFLEMVQRGKRFLKKAGYFEVTLFIGARNGILGYKDYDYTHLLREFWRLIPADSKRRILDDETCVIQFLETKCEELITSVLNEASARQIELMRNSSNGEMRVLLMDESVVSDETLMECRRQAALNSSNCRDDEEKRCKCESLSQLVDGYIERRNQKRRKVCS